MLINSNMECLLADCYWAVWGFVVRKKSRWSGAKWIKLFVKSGILNKKYKLFVKYGILKNNEKHVLYVYYIYPDIFIMVLVTSIKFQDCSNIQNK